MTVRIGMADAYDTRVLEAASRIAAQGSVSPVLVGVEPGEGPAGAEVLTPPAGEPGVEFLAAKLAASDLVAGVGGSVSTSSDVLRAGIKYLRSNALVSGCFAVRHRARWMTFGDCVVIPEPTAEQLAQIAADAADHHRRMFAEEPRVAMLSFSTGGSSAHPRVEKVRQATLLVRAARPELVVDGEVQFDVAVDAEVAARKAPDSPVAGRANVLVFPSLEAGNIAYKVAERIGGARALGSFVLGLRKPWVDLSRGCSVDDIVETVALLAGAVRAADRGAERVA